MFEEIKQRVYKANMNLKKSGLVLFTWGNVSEIDESREYVIIKPSGVNYDEMKESDMVVVRLSDGIVVDGKLRPSSDTNTHLEIYRNFNDVKGITHTHSTYAVSFAQAGMNLNVLGTTQADYFQGTILCTRDMTKDEVMSDYELNTGKVIVETINLNNVDVKAVPAILVKNHGPFIFGKSAEESVFNAVVLEEVAKMNYLTLTLNQKANIPNYIVEKHYQRKHGKNAYYGQRKD